MTYQSDIHKFCCISLCHVWTYICQKLLDVCFMTIRQWSLVLPRCRILFNICLRGKLPTAITVPQPQENRVRQNQNGMYRMLQTRLVTTTVLQIPIHCTVQYWNLPQLFWRVVGMVVNCVFVFNTPTTPQGSTSVCLMIYRVFVLSVLFYCKYR